jgi:hypothetical protein
MGIITDPTGGYTPPGSNIALPPASVGSGGGIGDIQMIGDVPWSSTPGSTLIENLSTSQQAVSTAAAGVTMSKSKGKSKAGATSKSRVNTSGQVPQKEGQKSQKNEGLKRTQEGTVKMPSEQLLMNEFDTDGIANHFETELLNGRLEFSRARVSFFVGNKAVRLFDQEDSGRVVEKAQLESLGFQIVDVSPARLHTLLTLRDVVRSVQEPL